MAQEAFVCPHCRTWVEGSGRVVRCPSCGQRFQADAARLAAARSRSEAPDLGTEGPADQDKGWELAGRAVDYGAEAPQLPDEEPLEATHASNPEDWPNHDAQEPVDAAEPRQQSLPLRMITSIGFLALIFVGRQYLSGEQFLVAIAVFFVAQWLLNKRLGHG
jgi:hypothetical protein